MESVLGGLTGHLTKRAVLVVLAPALVFWLGAFAAWSWHGMAWWTWGPVALVPGYEAWFSARSAWFGSLVIWEKLGLLGALVAASVLLAELFVLDFLQMAEGYWPRWIAFVLRWKTNRKERRIIVARSRLTELREKYRGSPSDGRGLSPEESRELIKLEEWLTIRSSEHRPMPTKLGDILTGAEMRPMDKYGLHVLRCFPRLWLVMPETTRKELTSTREALDAGARVWMWSLVFCLWALWGIWALPVGLAVACLAYRAMVVAGMDYADLLESSFDLHHTALFQALRWPLPRNPLEEQATGTAVSRYLWYPDRSPEPTFVHDIERLSVPISHHQDDPE